MTVLEFLTALTNELNQISAVRFEFHTDFDGSRYYPHIHLENSKGWGAVIYVGNHSDLTKNSVFDDVSMCQLTVPKAHPKWVGFPDCPQLSNLPTYHFGEWLKEYFPSGETKDEKYTKRIISELSFQIGSGLGVISSLALLTGGIDLESR
jgi:hypothetical protein